MKRLILIGILLLLGSFCFAQIQSPFRYGYVEDIEIEVNQILRDEAHSLSPAGTPVNQIWKNWLEHKKNQGVYPKNFILKKVETEGGQTKKIIIGPPTFSMPLPIISPCDKGIGPCLLFLFDKFLRFLYTVSLAIGVIVLIIAGISYMVKTEDVKKVHDKVKYGILGVVVAILAYTIVIAIERGFTEELATGPVLPGGAQTGGQVGGAGSGGQGGGQVGGGGTGGGGSTVGGGRTGGMQIITPKVTISDIRISKEGKIIFTYKSNIAICEINYSILDLETGESIETGRLSAATQMGIYSKDINEKLSGHSLKIVFSPVNPGSCDISPEYVNLTVPIIARAPTSGGTSPLQFSIPKVTINNPMITNDGDLTFTYWTDKGNCKFNVNIYDINKGIFLIKDKVLIGDENVNIYSYKIDISQYGDDNIMITFAPITSCNIAPKYISLKVPRQPIVVQNPKISINNMKIDGQQYIRIKLPEDITLRTVFQTFLKAGAQYFLYKPPFYGRIYFSTNEPAQKDGKCHLGVIIEGVSVPYVNVYDLSSATIKSFRKYIEIPLHYYKGRKSFVEKVSLDLDYNIVKGVIVHIYGYRGDCIIENMPIELGFININE